MLDVSPCCSFHGKARHSVRREGSSQSQLPSYSGLPRTSELMPLG